ncbi:hypothetical protein CEB3_c28120 [Peptococcaceae bacterium CEB3]|nr:hypothetical protein CEB3_c28120 [Peptococcaceae bacterium CEB3]
MRKMEEIIEEILTSVGLESLETPDRSASESGIKRIKKNTGPALVQMRQDSFTRRDPFTLRAGS